MWLKRPKVTFGAICLNEEEFIGAWLAQHYHLADQIILVEGAAQGYPPSKVTSRGLSTDRTSDIIRSYPDPHGKIKLIQHGWAGKEISTDPGCPAKVELRNRYAELADDGILFTLDIDEFICPEAFSSVLRTIWRHPFKEAFLLPVVHLFPDSGSYITGGYADIPHLRIYRWRRGYRYLDNHNDPCNLKGRKLRERMHETPRRFTDGEAKAAVIVHYGFCRSREVQTAKNQYYEARGEAVTRKQTLSFRTSIAEGVLPPDTKVNRYLGPLPEAMQVRK